ncbi:MAG TPA: pirin family protein [Methylophilaceae bacterium]|jgi:redox-sensitive bicupin YhaK (pirin superfamily)|nr:pirin family protein [Methylophilaceae bacterium]
MIQIRKANERGHAEHGWLESWHSFSFAEYYDAEHMGFSVLRVINEDIVAPGSGFGMHPHRDMEIVTYVLSGALQHQDSLGTGAVITAGEVQRMSAGTGIRHSEFNDSGSEPVHLLQIWILPERAGITPGYEQKRIPDEEKHGRWKAIATRDGRDDSLTIHQDAALYSAILDDGERIEFRPEPGRVQYLQVVRGDVSLNGEVLSAGDAAAVLGEKELSLAASVNGEVLLFDLPAEF